MLYQKITTDLKEALKSGNGFEAGVLRMVLAIFRNKEIDKKGKGLEPFLSDDEVVEILNREAKKRKESTEIYIKGGRNDLAEKEKKELEIIKKYLPDQIDIREVEKIIQVIIKKTEAKTIKEFGKVMAEAMKELRGRADTLMVSEAIKKFLTNE